MTAPSPEPTDDELIACYEEMAAFVGSRNGGMGPSRRLETIYRATARRLRELREQNAELTLMLAYVRPVGWTNRDILDAMARRAGSLQEPTDEMVERVARAIYPSIVAGTDYSDVSFEHAMARPRYLWLKERILIAARAALKAGWGSR